MKKKYAIMGMQIAVTQIYKRVEKQIGDCFSVTWEISHIEKRLGWIVGWRNVYNGELIWDAESYSFKPSEAVPHVLVSFYPTLQPVRVPLEACSGFVAGVPEPYCKSPNISRDVPRDKNGKFV